jgi:hypothetical protein
MDEKSVILKSERPSRAIIRVSSILLQVVGFSLGPLRTSDVHGLQ